MNKNHFVLNILFIEPEISHSELIRNTEFMLKKYNFNKSQKKESSESLREASGFSIITKRPASMHNLKFTLPKRINISSHMLK